MPIGATIGGAALAAGGTVAAGAMSSSAQRDAAQTAADSSYQVAQLNNQLYRDIYGQNLGVLAPYVNNGIQPSNALNDLLLGTHTFNPSAAPVVSAPAPTTGGTPASSYTGPSLEQIMAMQHDGVPGNYAAAMAAYNAAHAAPATGALAGYAGGDMAITPGQAHPPVPTGTVTTPAAAGTPAPATSGSTPATGTTPSALSAWDQFRNSTNYQFRLNQGLNALDSQWAAHGALDSGAASKAAIEYSQNFASNELSNYMSLLAGQQAMGLSAAGAVAGVGTTYAGNVAAQNTSAANAAANAALMNGQANAGMWGSIGGAAGQLGGALFQYGMGQMQPSMNFGATYNASNAAPWATTIPTAQPAPYLPGGF